MKQLKFIQDFQNKYLDSHLGGSIGLLLHGVDLKRSLDKSDIDLTVQIPLSFAEPIGIEDLTESSNAEDFEYAFRYEPMGSNWYFKVDVNLKPKSEFVKITHEGFEYRVSLLKDILVKKIEYAGKGVQKHIDDLIVIHCGVRPERKEEEKKQVPVTDIDDLPF